MPRKKEQTISQDLVTVCWLLSDSGMQLTQFIFEPGEHCQHPPAEARAVLNHLSQLPLLDLADLSTRLQRLAKLHVRLWSANQDCELCRFLHALSKEQPPGLSPQP